MRKLYAIILLIPALAMFAGLVTAASYCARVAATSPQCCEGRVDGCGQKCHQGQESKHQGQKGKSEQKGKDCGGCCIDCPLCSLVTFKSFFRLEVSSQVTIIDYTVMPNNNLSDYFQQHWKPPNVSPIS